MISIPIDHNDTAVILKLKAATLKASGYDGAVAISTKRLVEIYMQSSGDIADAAIKKVMNHDS